uniref:Helicase ATP-binding domain-containing protein n=1 Tax=viral metagenome TaxID=1070528 RepID=A0A6C0K4H1_9ZZZZ
MSTTALISDAELQVTSAGFKSTLWIPEFGWRPDEAEAAEKPHNPQYLAALQAFLYFFVAGTQRAWVHLAAEMQAGKTGVLNALLRLVFSNCATLKITPDRVFVITGMNDNAWVKQTKERLPFGVRSGVAHNGGLGKIVRALDALHAASPLANILIVVDESHLASSTSNRPNSLIYSSVAKLCPPEHWHARGIRFMTISATDPAKAVAIDTSKLPISARIVQLKTTKAYQSVETLSAAGRLRKLEDYGDLHKPEGIAELQRAVSQFAEPRIHILRARYGKQQAVAAALCTAFPEAIVRPWDSTTRAESGGDDTSSGRVDEDINDLLKEKPTQHIFVILKNMFYASKTMYDRYVGVMWDRVGGKDDTNLQSLLGRACGYKKSSTTVIYTSSQTVTNYLTFWREVISGSAAPAGLDAARLDNKMPGQRVKAAAGGGAPTLRVAQTYAMPGGGGGGGDGGVVEPPARVKKNEDDYLAETHEFASFAEAKVWARRIHEPKQINGFYQTSTTGAAKTLRYDEVLAFCSGKKTAGLPKIDVGKSVNRLSVGYKDLSKADSAVFIIRRITRLK